MLPSSKVQNLIAKHAQIEKELSSGEIEKKNLQRNPKNIPTLMR